MNEMLPLSLWVKKEIVILDLFRMELWFANSLDSARFPNRRTSEEWAEALALWREGKLL